MTCLKAFAVLLLAIGFLAVATLFVLADHFCLKCLQHLHGGQTQIDRLILNEPTVQQHYVQAGMAGPQGTESCLSIAGLY